MARVYKGRQQAYDNIAVGSAVSSQERTVPDLSGSKAGALPQSFSGIGNLENIAVGTDYGEEQIIKSGTALLEIEKVG